MKVFIDKQALSEILSRAYSGGDRLSLQGVWVDTETERVYATDGHRLAVRPTGQGDLQAPPFENITVGETVIAFLQIAKKHELNIVKQLKVFQKNEQIKIVVLPEGVKFSSLDGLRIVVHPCEATGRAETSVNTSYLLEALQKIQSRLPGRVDSYLVELRAPLGPLGPLQIFVSDDDYEIIMPMRG